MAQIKAKKTNFIFIETGWQPNEPMTCRWWRLDTPDNPAFRIEYKSMALEWCEKVLNEAKV